VLSVYGRAGAAEPALTLTPAADTSVPVRRSHRLRSVLLLAIVVLALAYLVLRMYS
jgi:hypothetical protein